MNLMKENCSLETTTEDAVSKIFEFLLGIDIYRLYLVSKSMRRRILTGNAVRTLTWDANTRVNGIPSFSLLFNHLQSFSFAKEYHMYDFWHITGKDILQLPKSLTELRLAFLGSHSLWFSHYVPSKIEYGAITNVKGTNQDFQHLYDLKAAFPQLQTLELNGENPLLATRLLTFFSPSLTSATINSPAAVPYRYDGAFPQNLRHLKLVKASFLDWNHLTPLTQLEELDIPGIVEIDTDFFSPSLKRLYLGWREIRWSANSLLALSRLNNLTALYNATTNMVKHLPANLTILTIGSGDSVNVETLQQLPKLLIMFSCSHFIGDLPDFECWPKGLTRLEFSLPPEVKFAPKDPRWRFLPRGLTELNITSDYLPVTIHPSVIPPLLKSVSIRTKNLENEIFDFSAMNRLSTLSVSQYSHYTSSNPVNGDSLNSDLAGPVLDSSQSPPSPFRFMLPSCLTTFFWCCQSDEGTTWRPDTWYFRDSFAEWFPDSLTSFYCDESKMLTDQFFVKLPAKLRCLTLNLREGKNRSLLSSAALKSLPPHLTTLIVVLNESADDSFVQFLPRGLEQLVVRKLTALNDSSAQHLPIGLKYLELRHVAHGLTDACIPSLPKTLVNFELKSNTSLTPEAFFSCSFPHLNFVDLRSNPNFRKRRILSCSASVELEIKGKKCLLKLKRKK
jgi:hypothetical protein